MRHLILVAAIFAAPWQVTRDAPAQPASGNGAIAGRVLTTSTPPQPVRRAVVSLSGTDSRVVRQFITDDDGRFSFPSLPAGRFSLTAEKPAYAKSYYGSVKVGRPPGTPVALAEGTVVAGLVIVLARGAVIAGRVTDIRGRPLASAQVGIARVAGAGASRRIEEIVDRVTTDERGAYRLFGLAAGEYTAFSAGSSGTVGLGVEETTEESLRAARQEIDAIARSRPIESVPPPPRPVTTARQYAPGVLDLDAAATFQLALGEERDDVNIAVPFVRSARVSGKSIDAGGQPMQNVWISMGHGGERECWASPGWIRPAADGGFVVPELAPGRYILYGRGAAGSGPPSGPRVALPLWAEAEFTVSESDVDSVVLEFTQGATLAGKVTFQTAAGARDPTTLRLGVERFDNTGCPDPAPLPSTSPAPDGSFVLRDVPPGRYLLKAAGLVAPDSVRAALVNGRDAVDEGMEIFAGRTPPPVDLIVTGQPGVLAGVVLDQLGRPAPEYSVILFPVDVALRRINRRIATVKLGSDARYRVSGLPPGDYFIAVLTDLDPRQRLDPTALDALVGASLRVSLVEGETRQQDLRIGR